MADFRKALPWVLAAGVMATSACGGRITVTYTDSDAPSSSQQRTTSPKAPPTNAPPTSSAPTPPKPTGNSTFVSGVEVTPDVSGAVVVQLVSGQPRLVACIAGKGGETQDVQIGVAGLDYRSRKDITPYRGQPQEPTRTQEFSGRDGTVVSCLARDVNFGAAAADINLYVVAFTPAGGSQDPNLDERRNAPVAVPNTPPAALDGIAVADHEIQKMCGMLSKWASVAAGKEVRVSLAPCDVDQVVPSDPLPTPTGQQVSALGRKAQASGVSRVSQRRPVRVGSGAVV